MITRNGCARVQVLSVRVKLRLQASRDQVQIKHVNPRLFY